MTDYLRVARHLRCTIAGGAPRDIYHGHTPKDYDLWTWEDLWVWDVRAAGYLDAEVKGEGVRDTVYDEDHIKRVLSFTHQGNDYDLMVIDPCIVGTLSELLFTFYADICQMWIDGEGKVKMTIPARDAIDRKIITLTDTDKEKYLTKLQHLVDSHGYVIEEEQEEKLLEGIF